MQSHFVVFRVKGVYMRQTSLALPGLELPFHFKTSIKPEMNHPKRLHPSRRWTGALARCCMWLPLLAWCLSNPSAWTVLSRMGLGELVLSLMGYLKTGCMEEPVQKAFLQGKQLFKTCYLRFPQLHGHPDLWHPFNQITNTESPQWLTSERATLLF